MWELLKKAFDSDLMPHGHCYLWRPEIVWLNVIPDLSITLAYYSIPFILLHIVRKRRDVEYSWMFVMFSVFIFACGTTHLMEVWNVWHAAYRLAGFIKVVTAAASIGTALLLVPLIPKVVSLPSPKQLKAANQKLQNQMAERLRAEKALQKAHDELEQRVEERTAQLQTSLWEKEALLKEIHHRVKNNLQVISSLLSLQSKVVKDKAALDMFKESQQRVKSMALIHEELYKSADLTRIEIAPYIRNLIAHLRRSYRGNADDIALQVEVAEVSLDVDRAIPCGLIINELVSNSLKHAFPASACKQSIRPKNEIRVELYAQPDGRLALRVKDNGVGLPEGLDARRTESLGLQLVHTLTEQLRGAIECHNVEGTEFEITFAGGRLTSTSY